MTSDWSEFTSGWLEARRTLRLQSLPTAPQPCLRCGDTCSSQLEHVPIDGTYDSDEYYAEYGDPDETDGWYWTLCSGCDSNLDEDWPEDDAEWLDNGSAMREPMYGQLVNVDGRVGDGGKPSDD